jgi:hypothetical protein
MMKERVGIGERVMKQIIAVALFMSMFGALRANAQPIYPERPMKLRVTGTLLPVEQVRREDLILIDIFVQDKPWLLRIGKVEELNPSGREPVVKEDILLRQVRFYGPDSLLARLQGGKVLTIEGQLDTKQRRFLVTAVKEAAETDRQGR